MFAKGTVWFRNVLGVLLLGMMLLAAFTVLAYPSRSIKIIVPYAAGGAVDIVTRAIAQPLAEALKQPVIVDNRPGASANIGMELAAKSPPDGYVLLMASNAIATNMALFPHLAFDGQHDFLPIAKIGYAPLVIVVPASSPAKSLKDLIAMAKAQPGTLTYASAGNGRATWRASCSSRRRRSMPCTFLTREARPQSPIFWVSAFRSCPSIRSRCWRISAAADCARSPSLATSDSRCCPMCQPLPRQVCPVTRRPSGGDLSRRPKRPWRLSNDSTSKRTRRLRIRRLQASWASLGVVVTPGTSDQFAVFIRSQTELWSGVIKSARIQPD